MQLSINARKAVATGLAISTLLWAGAAGLAPIAASASVHSDGCLVLSGGIVWMITGGTRRGFTSAEVFQSYGYNFSQVTQATAEDVALPVGPIMTYADGTLVMDPSMSPLVYLVSGGQKRGFTTAAVLTGLGFSFSNVQVAPNNTFSDLPVGANLDNTTSAHGAGVLVISNGGIWMMTATGRQGFPSIAVFNSFGYNLAHVVAANAADLASPDQGAVVARPGCTGGNTTPSGSVYVSLSSDTPLSNTVVAGQSTADLAHFTFGGSGAVTQLTLQRTGVSSNDLLTNVYLYNGSLRITDGSAVNSSGQIVFSNSTGLFNAPATISVRADIESSVSGQTVGVAFASGMSGSSSVTGSASSNLMSVANPADLATATFSANQVTGTIDVNAGSLNYSIWTAPLAIANRSVWLKSLMLKGIGSAPVDAFQNYILYVDGNQVATAAGLTAVNGSNYAVFALSTPFSLTTGSHTLDVRADVVKGSDRNMTFSLQNAADVMVTDSSYNVNVTPAGTVPNTAAELDIQKGFVSVQLDPAFSGTTTVAGGATNVPLAKFKFTGYGEDVQINSLVVDVTDQSSSALSDGLNNVALYVNGAQVGSNKQLVNPATTVTFTLGSSFIVPAGSTDSVEVRADTINHSNATISSGTVMIALINGDQSAGNGQGRSSQSTFTVPGGDVTAQALTIGAGGMSVSANAGYPGQTISPNTAAAKIGSFTLQAGNNEAIRISNLAVGLKRATDGTTDLTNTESAGNWPALTNFANLKVSINGGTPSSPINPQASNNFSQNFTVAQNTTATVDVWADLSTEGANDAFKATLLPTAYGVTSNTNAYTGSAVVGQQITLAAGSLGTPTFSTSGSSDTQFVAAAGGATDGSINNFKLIASSGAVTVTELKVSVLGTSGTVSSVKIGNISSPVVTPATTTVTSGLANTTDPVTFVAASTANITVGTVINDTTGGNEDMLVTAVSGSNVTVARAKNGTSAHSHANASTINIYGSAYLTGLSIGVPQGVGGVNVNVLPTYTSVGVNGVSTGSTAAVALSYAKYTTGSTSSSSAIGPIVANTMDLVGSRPTLSVSTTSSGGLHLGENHLMDVTVVANSKGNIQVNQIQFLVSASGGPDGISLPRLAIGSTTITSSSCDEGAGDFSDPVVCTLPADYVITAGTSQTFSLYATIAASGGLGSSGNSSVTSSLDTSDNFIWEDLAGNSTTAIDTANSTYLNNYPSQTWTITN